MTAESLPDIQRYAMIGYLTDYSSTYDAVPNPNVYPGERPDQSYVIGDGQVYGVEVDNQDGKIGFAVRNRYGDVVPIDTFLADHGVPGMEDRIPLMGFGANASPNVLAHKFRSLSEPTATVVPTIYAMLAGHDVVWSGAPGINGNFLAILYGGPEVANSRVQVAINFLTREQLLAMNATERSYNLSTHTVDIADKKVRAYYYAGVDMVYMCDGQPVAIEGVLAQNRTLPTGTTKQLMDTIIANPQVMTAARREEPALATVHSTAEYIAFAAQLHPTDHEPKPKTRLKQVMLRAIAEAGHSAEVIDTNAEPGLVSWANPSTLASYGDQLRGVFHHDTYVLPTQEISSSAAAQRISQTLTSHLVYVSGGGLKERTVER